MLLHIPARGAERGVACLCSTGSCAAGRCHKREVLKSGLLLRVSGPRGRAASPIIEGTPEWPSDTKGARDTNVQLFCCDHHASESSTQYADVRTHEGATDRTLGIPIAAGGGQDPCSCPRLANLDPEEIIWCVSTHIVLKEASCASLKNDAPAPCEHRDSICCAFPVSLRVHRLQQPRSYHPVSHSFNLVAFIHPACLVLFGRSHRAAAAPLQERFFPGDRPQGAYAALPYSLL